METHLLHVINFEQAFLRSKLFFIVESQALSQFIGWMFRPSNPLLIISVVVVFLVVLDVGNLDGDFSMV